MGAARTGLKCYNEAGIGKPIDKPAKTVRWMGSSRKDLRVLSKAVKYKVGRALGDVQKGQMPRDAKVLQGFGGANVLEIRAEHQGNAYRAVYTVRFRELVYVLHVFQKKSKKGSKTPPNVIDLIHKRLTMAEQDYEQWKATKGNSN